MELTKSVDGLQIAAAFRALYSAPLPSKATDMFETRSTSARNPVVRFRTACLTLALGVFVSCQTTTSTEGSRTGEKTILLDVPEALVPDRAFATYPGSSEKPATIALVSGTEYSFTVNVDKALGANDNLRLNLVSYGMVTTVVAYVMNSDGELVRKDANGIERDTLARTIIRRLDGSSYAKSELGVIQAYADALLENQPLFQPYPQIFPKGLDTAKVRMEALRKAAKTGKSLEQLASSWGLALSYQNARKQILALVPSISSEDSAVLFPPPHVRVEQALSSLGELGAGGDAVGIAGSIASDIALASVDIDVLDANGNLASDKFAIRCSQPKGTVLWDLVKDGQVTIKAVNAAPGTYTVQIIGRDIQGRSTVLTLEITVKISVATDDQGPVIKLVSPVSDTTVEHMVATYDVIVSAVDPSGVDSVAIGGAAASKNPDGNWHRIVVLETTGAPTLIPISAFDMSGNPTSTSVQVTRSAPQDNSKPTLTLVSPATKSGQVIPVDSGFVTVRWKATDVVGIAATATSINGLVATKEADSCWSLRVGLAPTGVAVAIPVLVTNIKGVPAADTVSVARELDTIRPKILRLGTNPTTVSFATTSAIVGWTVTDNHRMESVSINGAAATVKGVDYSSNVNLVVGDNKVVLLAKDSLGNERRDTVVVTRAKDLIPPQAVLLSGLQKKMTVNFATTTLKVGWTITDNATLGAVTIAGSVATQSGDEYSNSVNLVVGDNVIALLAKDADGNEARDTMIVTRSKDLVPPVATLLTGLEKNMTVDYSVTSQKIGWTISDNDKVASVLINKVAVVGANGEYSTSLTNLAMGETKVYLEAKDLTGNVSYDTVTVTRVLGASPTLVFSHAEGIYDTTIRVSINSSVPEAEIRYTLDGTDPTETNGFSYTVGGAILIGQTRTLKVIATAVGHTPTPIITKVYTYAVSPVSFSIPSGTVTDTIFKVKVASATAGVTYYYTLDGSSPIANSSPSAFNGEISIDSIRTVKVIAVKSGWNSSPIVTATYRANIPLKVFVGEGGSKVIRADGSLWTTGRASSLTDGSSSSRTTFEKAMEGVQDVNGSLILMRNGDVFAYGGAFGSTASSNLKIASGMTKIAASTSWSKSAMMVSSQGTLFAVGANDAGHLCTGDYVDVSTPVQIPGVTEVKSIGVGCNGDNGSYFCGSVYITTAGNAFGCGSIDLGVTRSDETKPAQLAGSGYSDVFIYNDVFRGSNLASYYLLTANGVLQTVDGKTVQTGVVKAVPLGESDFILQRYGWLYAKGLNNGTFGDGTIADAADWTLISNGIADISSDGERAMIIKADGSLWATGYNGGSFGNGTTADALKFVRVPLGK